MFSYCIFNRCTDEFIGIVSLSNINYKYENSEIGYWILDKKKSEFKE